MPKTCAFHHIVRKQNYARNCDTAVAHQRSYSMIMEVIYIPRCLDLTSIIPNITRNSVGKTRLTVRSSLARPSNSVHFISRFFCLSASSVKQQRYYYYQVFARIESHRFNSNPSALRPITRPPTMPRHPWPLWYIDEMGQNEQMFYYCEMGNEIDAFPVLDPSTRRLEGNMRCLQAACMIWDCSFRPFTYGMDVAYIRSLPMFVE
jgi:hypothetical protein